jgi:hypothetical protein
MNEAEPQTRDFVDRSLRELLSRPVNLEGFLGAVVPDLIAGFDFAKMRPAHREYFLGQWRSREADLLFEIPYRLPDREDWALVCILLEHQTKTDWRTPLTTLIYAALYWEWQLRQWEVLKSPRPDFLLRPILPVVLHTGSRPWGTVKTLRDLLVEPAVFRSFLPDWQPLFWELAQHSPDQLLHSREALLQVLALLRVEDQEQADAVRTFRSVLQQLDPLHDTNFVRWEDLIRFILGWATHRRPPEERPLWSALAEDMQADEQRKQELKAMHMTIADEIRLEGKAEGKAEALREVLLDLGRQQLGEPDAATLQALESITDVDHLKRMTRVLLQTKSWIELVASRSE